MLTQDQINAIEADLQNGLTLAQSTAGVIDPQLVPFIIIGRAVALAFPPIANDVEAMLAKQEPTAADIAALAQGIAGLFNPGSL